MVTRWFWVLVLCLGWASGCSRSHTINFSDTAAYAIGNAGQGGCDLGQAGGCASMGGGGMPPLPMPGGPSSVVHGEGDDDANVVFDPAAVETYTITVDPDDLARVDADPKAEEYVPAYVSFRGQSYGPIGFRYKGSSGSFLVPCTASTTPGMAGPKVGKCSIKLAFDEYDDNARFFGLKKVNLHSMGRDLSLMRERLGYGLYREMNVASPRTAYARVLINGKLEGAFLAVEEIDGRFTRSRFEEGGTGNLYKEVWPVFDDPRPYRNALESNKGVATDVDKMRSFAADVKRDPSAALAWIAPDYLARYIAVDRVQMNDDGVFHWYCYDYMLRDGSHGSFANNHNYFWYEESKAGRMWLIPWDLDGSFANEPRVFIDREWSEQTTDCDCHTAVGFAQRAPSCDPLTGQFGPLRPAYDQAVNQLLAGPYSENVVADKLSAWSQQIGPLVDEANGALGAPDRAAWQKAMGELQDVVKRLRDNRGYAYGKTPD
jgi:hypothetical protein